MENKQTAVDWFIEQLEQKGDAWENVSIRRVQISIDVSEYLDLKRQAKEMQKEEIENAYRIGFVKYLPYTNAEEYYTITYGGNK